MAMNYVGSVTLLDRGDGPAQAVLDRNARSLAQRVAEETKEELARVMSRVDHIYGNFEVATNLYESNRAANMEYINDLSELEDLLRDQVKKKKYQQQVTVFIVGYENVCGQKLRLLQQVNEFFMENAQKIEQEDDSKVHTPEVDLDSMSDVVEDSLKTANELAMRLGELNREMIDYMYNYAQARASNSFVDFHSSKNRGKKKLEKALAQAKDDIQALNEKLLGLQQDIEDKEDKMQQLYKQMELKSIEAQRYKTAAEVAKRNAEEGGQVHEELKKRDEIIRDLNKQIDALNIDVEQVEHSKNQTQQALKNATQETQNKVSELEAELEETFVRHEQGKREIERNYENQITELNEIHRAQTEETRHKHELEIKKLLDDMEALKDKMYEYLAAKATTQTEVEEVRRTLEQVQGEAYERTREANRAKRIAIEAEQERNMMFKKAKEAAQNALDLRRVIVRKTEEEKEKARDEEENRKLQEEVERHVKEFKIPRWQQKDATEVSAPAKKGADSKAARKPQPGKKKEKGGKEYAEVAIQDDGGDPSKAQVAEYSVNAEGAADMEGPVEFDDEFPLEDEEAWACIPPLEVPGRFVQYRYLAQQRIMDLEEDMEATVKKTTRKIHTLKAQFQDHKSKWESERSILMEEMRQAAVLQSAAEKEADSALTQLEDFIQEQEMLETEEDEKRRSLSERVQVAKGETGLPNSVVEAAEALEQTLVSTQADVSLPAALLQQTDDAKAAMSRASSKSSSMSPELRPGSSNFLGDEERSSSSAWTGRPPSPRKHYGPRSALRSAASSRKSYSVTFPGVEKETSFREPSEELPANIAASLKSLKDMLTYISPLTAAQQTAQAMVRSALFGPLEEVIESSESLSEQLTTEENTSLLIYSLLAHLAQESVALGIDPASLMKACARLVETSLHEKPKPDILSFLTLNTPDFNPEKLRKIWVKTDWSRDHTQLSVDLTIEGDTAEAIRASSAKSRASLRSLHKDQLVAMKSALSDRRSRSSTLTSPHSFRSVLSDAKLDEYGDMPFPEDTPAPPRVESDVKKRDAAVSPMTPSIASPSSVGSVVAMADHPVVEEFLRSYESVLTFKENLSRVFIDKEMTSAGQVLIDIEPVGFNREEKVQPQLETMANNALIILEEAVGLINGLLENTRDYPVSSMDPSREPTRLMQTREQIRSPDSKPVTPALRSSPSKAPQPRSAPQPTVEESQELLDLQYKYQQLTKKTEEDAKQYEQQLEHNTVMMMEMQDTINALQRELEALTQQQQQQQQQQMAPADQQALLDTPILFTRLDSERNAKVLKKAVQEERINNDKFQEVVHTMDEYVGLPAKRLAHLVRKYVHHCQMKVIEENVRQSKSLNNNVYIALDKMEALQNARAHRWAEQMDQMGVERLKLAAMLMERLEDLESQSGIFLIKPMFSFKGNFNPDKYTGKLSRPYRPQREFSSMTAQMALAGMSTPGSHMRSRQTAVAPPTHKQAGLAAKVPLVGGEYPRPVWHPMMAQCRPLEDFTHTTAHLNTPRLLELDINRMLIGQNQISMRVNASAPSDDRLANAANGSVRNYITVSRPTGQGLMERLGSAEYITGAVPPTTPMKDHTLTHGLPTDRRRASLSQSPTLPPIQHNGGKAGHATDGPDHPYPPHSPPGSSLRQTPPNRDLMGSPYNKIRPPSEHSSAISLEAC